MAYYISVKETGMKVHRPIKVYDFDTGSYFIERRIAFATVLSDRSEAEELARVVSKHYPPAHCKVLCIEGCKGLSLQATRDLRMG